MKTPYSYADEELQDLKQFVSAKFHNAANVMSFDEVNITDSKALALSLYKELTSQNKKVFERVAKKSYKATIEEVGAEPKDWFDIATLIAILLKRYHPITQYKYSSEVERKRDRFMESMLSATDDVSFRNSFNSAASRWFDQSRQYTDFAVAEGRKQALKDAGVKYVKWQAEKDERTCEECKGLDGQIFKIDEVPEIPMHRRCRCWLVPVLDRQ